MKVVQRREKAEKPTDVEDSSQLSQSAMVEVDISGRYPVVAEGEDIDADIPAVKRVRKRKPEQEPSSSLSPFPVKLQKLYDSMLQLNCHKSKFYKELNLIFNLFPTMIVKNLTLPP